MYTFPAITKNIDTVKKTNDILILSFTPVDSYKIRKCFVSAEIPTVQNRKKTNTKFLKHLGNAFEIN